MEDNKPIIKASTPNSKKYDTKIDIYTSDPKGPHDTIHIAVDSDTKTAHIIDTTNGPTEHTDVSCFLTTACMKHYLNNFDDNCYELTTLRWFRDKFVSKEDIEHYYETAPIIVDAIDKIDNCDEIYNDIYENIISVCIKAIENNNYELAYETYKQAILNLEEEYARTVLEHRLVKVMKLNLMLG